MCSFLCFNLVCFVFSGFPAFWGSILAGGVSYQELFPMTRNFWSQAALIFRRLFPARGEGGFLGRVTSLPKLFPAIGLFERDPPVWQISSRRCLLEESWAWFCCLGSCLVLAFGVLPNCRDRKNYFISNPLSSCEMTGAGDSLVEPVQMKYHVLPRYGEVTIKTWSTVRLQHSAKNRKFTVVWRDTAIFPVNSFIISEGVLFGCRPIAFGVKQCWVEETAANVSFLFFEVS